MLLKTMTKMFGLLLVVALVAAACGDSSGGDASTTTAGAASPSGGDASPSTGVAAGGPIFVSGSSTVEPISIRVAEAFAAENPDADIAVEGPGTGDGFKKFCTGETDISDASRAIKDSEAEDCAAAGVNYVELKVGIDGIAVMSGPGNPNQCLSFPDLYALVSPEATGFSNWSDANDLNVEVGGSGDFPDTELTITAPGTESGTYASFIEIVLEDTLEERGEEITTRPDYQSSADDNVIIENVSSDDGSFGWVGFAFAEANKDRLKVFEISEEDGGECIAPTPETIADNTYPISRDLFIYVNTDKAATNSTLTAFVDFYMSYGLETAVADAKYVPLDDASLQETRNAWKG